MAFLQIKSTNPNFSHIIRKNPESGMFIKDVRQGLMFGWFNDTDTFNIFFKDAANEVSYKINQDEEFEYNNITRYNSPLFVTNAITEYMGSAVSKPLELDTDGFEHTINVNLFQTRSVKYFEIFSRYYEDFKIEYKEVAKNNYSISFTTKKSLYQLFNFVSLFSIFNVITNRNEYIHEAQVDKYLGYLSVIDSPYFVRYVFKVNFLRNFNKFQKNKGILDASAKAKIEMQFGDTQLMRMEAIKKMFTMDNSIVDVGCGEGRYLTHLARHLSDKTYFAIDSDPEQLAWAQKRADNKKVENACLLASYDEFEKIMHNDQEKLDFLFTEVMEHMEISEASMLIHRMTQHPNFNSIVITTPNQDFNEFYKFEDNEMRHADHKFELKLHEFQGFISQIAHNLKVTFYEIGDKVNGSATTLGAKIERA